MCKHYKSGWYSHVKLILCNIKYTIFSFGIAKKNDMLFKTIRANSVARPLFFYANAQLPQNRGFPESTSEAAHLFHRARYTPFRLCFCLKSVVELGRSVP